MSAPTPEELGEAARWLGGAEDELVAARVFAGHPEAPGRAACFHAHLSAEQTLKALLIGTGVGAGSCLPTHECTSSSPVSRPGGIFVKAASAAFPRYGEEPRSKG